MIQKLYNLAADWEERGQKLHDKRGNTHPIQANELREAMRLCAAELREELEKMKGEK